MKWKLKFQKHLIKFLSVIFAFFVWLYVVNSAQVESDKEVKVNYKLPTDFAISNEVPKTVIFTLKGPRGFIKAIQKRSDQVVIDLEKVYVKNKKSYRFDVKNLGLDFPFGVALEQTDPAYIQVNVERKITKKVPVSVQTISQIRDAHELVSSQFEPQMITISGAYSVIKNIDAVVTLPIDLSTLKGSGSKEVGFEVKDRRVDYEIESGKYHYEVRSTQSNLLLAQVPITFMTTQLIRNVNRRNVNLMVLARDGSQAQIDKEKVKVLADISPGSEGQVVVELKAILPDGYELVEIRPDKVSVQVE